MFPSCSLSLPRAATGFVERPDPAMRDVSQSLVLLSNEFRPLEGGEGEPYILRPAAMPLYDGSFAGAAYCPSSARHAVYERATDCVYFTEGYAIMRLDSCNVVTLVAGSKQQSGSEDGPGSTARFHSIVAVVAGEAGTIYVAEGQSVRKLVLGCIQGSSGSSSSDAPGSGHEESSGEGNGPSGCAGGPGTVCTVSTLPRSTPQHGSWRALAYDPEGEELLVSTAYAVCLVSPTVQPAADSDSGGGNSAPEAPQVIAGHWSTYACTDGVGAAARFENVLGLLPMVGRRTCVLDSDKVRYMDQQRTVGTVVRQGMPSGNPCSAMLSSVGGFVTFGYYSDLRVYYVGGSFTSANSCHQVGGSGAFALAKHLSAPAQATNSGDGISCLANAGAFLTVQVRGEAFVAHRSVLAARSEYFRQLLQSGFAESSAGVVNLPDADPQVFGLLLEYMYSATLRVPDSLLRPTVELAGRLLMPEVCVQLKPRLLALCCTPQTAAVDLLWAERHNATELLPALKAYFVRHHKEIAVAAPETVRQLLSGSAELRDEVVLAALAAP